MKNHKFCLKFQVNRSNLSPTTLQFMCFFLLLFPWKKTHLRTPRSPWVLPEKQNSGPLPEHETQLLGRLLQGALAWIGVFFFIPQKNRHFLVGETSWDFFEKAGKIHTQFWEKWGWWERRWNSILSKWVNKNGWKQAQKLRGTLCWDGKSINATVQRFRSHPWFRWKSRFSSPFLFLVFKRGSHVSAECRTWAQFFFSWARFSGSSFRWGQHDGPSLSFDLHWRGDGTSGRCWGETLQVTWRRLEGRRVSGAIFFCDGVWKTAICQDFDLNPR